MDTNMNAEPSSHWRTPQTTSNAENPFDADSSMIPERPVHLLHGAIEESHYASGAR